MEERLINNNESVENSETEYVVDLAPSDECKTSDQVYDYYLDSLSFAEAERVASHIERCSYCQDIYFALQGVITAVRGNPEIFFPDKVMTPVEEEQEPPLAMEANGR